MEFSADLIAQQVGGIIEGDGSVTVSTFSKIEEAGPGSITFLANPKYTHFIYSTGAFHHFSDARISYAVAYPSRPLLINGSYDPMPPCPIC